MKKTLYDIPLKEKVVFVRVDFNVPLWEGKVGDDTRIIEAMPTIHYLVSQRAKVVLLSHLGKINHKEEEACQKDKQANDMVQVVSTLEKHLGKSVLFWNRTRDLPVSSLQAGQVALLQNTRYEKQEEKNGEELASYWASLADVYVMDAFGTAHREHASTYGLPKKMSELGKETAIGFLVEKEVHALHRCVIDVKRPYVAVLGGVKVSSKIKVLEALLKKVDKILIGGAMGHTFLAAMGYHVANARIEKDQFDFVHHCLEVGKDKLYVTIDHVIANDFSCPTIVKISDNRIVEEGFMPLDIGPKTREYFADQLKTAKTIFWNGPMGVFENPLFAEGTKAICKTIAGLVDVFSVIGGGDSAAASAQFGYKDGFSHVSTGGGASLEMIENDGHLPGIDVIQERGA